MPQELVSPEDFLTRLSQCFSEPSTSSSVWLTHKRCMCALSAIPVMLTLSDTYDDGDVQMESQGSEEAEHDVLIRCTQDHSKFSSRIPASRLVEFHSKYSSLLKASMAPHMRKRDKKKEKAKAEGLAKRRRELMVDVVIGNEGKRGKGHRQRSRKVAAQKKKEAEREKLELATQSQMRQEADQTVINA
ncbi:signal recognition particle subunit SRP14, partial [Tremellales sp. Uapishka_1]